MGQDNPEEGCHWPSPSLPAPIPCPSAAPSLMPPRARAFLSQRLCPYLPPARVLGCQEAGGSKAIAGPSSPPSPRRDPARNSPVHPRHHGFPPGPLLPCSAAYVLSPLICRGRGPEPRTPCLPFPAQSPACHPHPHPLLRLLQQHPEFLPILLLSLQCRPIGSHCPGQLPSEAQAAAHRLHQGRAPSGLPPCPPGSVCALPAYFPPGLTGGHIQPPKPLPPLTPLLLGPPRSPHNLQGETLHLANSPPLLAQPPRSGS